jgi:hypothetical protein
VVERTSAVVERASAVVLPHRVDSEAKEVVVVISTAAVAEHEAVA